MRWKDHLLASRWFLGTGPTAPQGNYVTVSRPAHVPNLIGHGTSNAPSWRIAGAELDQAAARAAVERYRSAITHLPADLLAEPITREMFNGGKVRAGEMWLSLSHASGGVGQLVKFNPAEASGPLREVAAAVHELAGVTRHIGRI